MTPKQRTAVTLSIATALAIPAEGLRQVAYYDPPGILTTCRGHTGPDVIKGKRYSLAECDQYLNLDMRKAILIVDKCQPGLSVEVLAAFSDAVFNLGATVACDTSKSTAARKLKSGDLAGACNELPRWSHAKIMGVQVELPGLVKRRSAEQALCLTGVPA